MLACPSAQPGPDRPTWEDRRNGQGLPESPLCPWARASTPAWSNPRLGEARESCTMRLGCRFLNAGIFLAVTATDLRDRLAGGVTVRSLLTLSVCGLAIWASVPVHGQGGRTYTTNFPATENPISEGGNWRNGQREGVVWKDIRTVPGLAFGTQGGSPPPYDDSTAVLGGTWGPDQTVEAKVKTVNQNGSINQEVEIRLRTSINPNSLSGYEILFKVTHDGSQYHQIVRWHGPLGTASCNWGCAFSEVPGSRNMRAGDGFPGVYDGDTIGASVIGNRIRTWIIHNGVKQVLQDINDTSGAGGGSVFHVRQPRHGFLAARARIHASGLRADDLCRHRRYRAAAAGRPGQPPHHHRGEAWWGTACGYCGRRPGHIASRPDALRSLKFRGPRVRSRA